MKFQKHENIERITGRHLPEHAGNGQQPSGVKQRMVTPVNFSLNQAPRRNGGDKSNAGNHRQNQRAGGINDINNADRGGQPPKS